MKPIALEWVAKAEGDFRSARRERQVQSEPNSDPVCFLSQQCAEKCLKGLLYELDIRFAKTHDLPALLALGVKTEPSLAALRLSLEALNDYAVEFRYPGESATLEEARIAFDNCQAARLLIRKLLGLDEPPSAQMKLRVKERKARYRVRPQK